MLDSGLKSVCYRKFRYRSLLKYDLQSVRFWNEFFTLYVITELRSIDCTLRDQSDGRSPCCRHQIAFGGSSWNGTGQCRHFSRYASGRPRHEVSAQIIQFKINSRMDWDCCWQEWAGRFRVSLWRGFLVFFFQIIQHTRGKYDERSRAYVCHDRSS